MLLIAQLCEEKTKVVVKLVMFKFAGEILYACPGSKTWRTTFRTHTPEMASLDERHKLEHNTQHPRLAALRHSSRAGETGRARLHWHHRLFHHADRPGPGLQSQHNWCNAAKASDR